MVRAISNQPILGENSLPNYTPEQATATLPLVRRVVRDLLALQEQMVLQRRQLAGIEQLSKTVECETHREELTDVKVSLAQDREHWDACIAELQSLGLEVEEPFTGHIDFPARLGRRPIRLCWYMDEESVQHWHEVDEARCDRKMIEQGMIPALAT